MEQLDLLKTLLAFNFKNKKVMNKKIFILILLLFFTLPSLISAEGAPTTIASIVETVKNQLTALSAGLATIAFIVAGIMFLSATGNPQRMQIAKASLIAGVIGIVIIVLANGAEAFVKTFFGL